MTDGPLERPQLHGVPTTHGEPEARAFVARQHDRLRTGAGYVFAIAGAGARASIGYWITASQRRRGYAAEALGVLTEWARHHPDLAHFTAARSAAEVVSTVRDLPSNHSPLFAPMIEPTLTNGVATLTTAALAWLAPLDH